MSRDTRLSLWPEETGYLPLLSSWYDIKNRSVLDLSTCYRVDSCGLAGSVIKVHNILELEKKRQMIESKGQLDLPLNDYKSVCINKIYTDDTLSVEEKCIKLNFFAHIKEFIDSDVLKDAYQDTFKDPITIDDGGCLKISFPILRIPFTEYPADRRFILEDFVYAVENYFNCIPKKYNFKKEQFITTLTEIAKNSADHTSGDAFMGCDLIYSGRSARLSVVIGDLGPGIYAHLRPYIESIFPQRKGKLGLSEVYKWALEDGNSSKVMSGKNMGFGMSFIIGHCKALNAKLSVFDVKSRGMLSSIVPMHEWSDAAAHNAVWRCFQRIDGVKPFFYYIELGL